MLAGVYLVDESAPDSGNLWVWPGSHLVHERVFREQGPAALLATSGHACFLAAPPRYGEPVQVLAKRGDLLLAHFLLGHNIGPNTSKRTRRIVYYRLSCPGHESRWADTFTSAPHRVWAGTARARCDQLNPTDRHRIRRRRMRTL